jgi:hypothetical protein
VTHGDDDFQVDALDLAGQIVQLGLAFWLQDRLVEVKERVSGVGDLGCSDCRLRLRQERLQQALEQRLEQERQQQEQRQERPKRRRSQEQR